MKKITRTKQPDMIQYAGDALFLTFYIGSVVPKIMVNDRWSFEEHIFYIDEAKELAQILPEFIKEIEKEV